MNVSFFYHTRTSARRARGPSSFAWTTPSRTPTILILEDPCGYFRVTFASYVDPSLNKRIIFLQTLFIISIMTLANRVYSLSFLNGSCQARALLRWTFFDRA